MPRKTRSGESREANTRKTTERVIPQAGYRSRLYVNIEEIPRGVAYYWGREKVHNEPDDGRMTELLINGWKPVPASRHPNMIPPPLPDREAIVPTVLRNGGLLLLEKPLKDVNADFERQRRDNYDMLMGLSEAAGGGLQDTFGTPYTVDVNQVSVQSMRKFAG